jgi:arylsulfatase
MPGGRRLALLLALSGAVTSACGGASPPPNVLLISIDCLNQRRVEEAWNAGRAPQLARLAEDSLVFSRGYAHAPWTTPSHMSMITGLYPSQHGRDIPFKLQSRFNDAYDRVPLFRTLPERLAASGYQTVAFVGMGPVSGEFGLDQGFDLYHQSPRHRRKGTDLPETRSRLADWLRGAGSSPFFLFVHTFDLHFPLAPKRPTFARSLDYIDAHVGGLMSELRERGLYDSSLIILTGDHGSRMIRKGNKCCVHGAGHYEENLRVPFLLKLPSPGRAGGSDQLVRHVDILPTVLDVVGLPLDPYVGPGSSILGREPAGPGVSSYSEADARCWSRRAVVEERYKYIHTPRDPAHLALRHSDLFFDGFCRRHPPCEEVPTEELYDLGADPFEEANLLEGPLDPDGAAALERLRTRLAENLELPRAYRTTPVPGERPQPAMDESLLEGLRALGYLE